MGMQARFAILGVCMVLSGAVTPGFPQRVEGITAGQSSPNNDRKAERENSSSLTGCMDEQDGGYVLLKEGTLTPLASLQAEGFDNEGFAKHLGHKVTVRGSATSADGKTVFKVRRIDHVSDSCAPGPPQ
jgi:hypothetical protein